MPRLKHVQAPGFASMVTTVTHKRKPYFERPEHAQALLEAIDYGRTKGWYFLLAFVIMPEHLHLLLVPKDRPIPACVQAIKGYTARRLNLALERHGHLWQEGYFDLLIGEPKKALKRVAYIEANPIRRGLAETPETYPFSSAARRGQTDFAVFFG